jgi:hypothetical protein
MALRQAGTGELTKPRPTDQRPYVGLAVRTSATLGRRFLPSGHLQDEPKHGPWHRWETHQRTRRTRRPLRGDFAPSDSRRLLPKRKYFAVMLSDATVVPISYSSPGRDVAFLLSIFIFWSRTLRAFLFLLILFAGVAAVPLRSQDLPPGLPMAPEPAPTQASIGLVPQAAPIMASPGPTGLIFCPGEFPTNFMVPDCRFRQHQRWENFVTSSVSDQAVLGSLVGSLGGQIIESPAEWPRTWHFYGYRLAASYSGGLARGIVEFSIGSAAQSDPRHVRCSEGPLLLKHYSLLSAEHPENGQAQAIHHCSGISGQLVFRPTHVLIDAFSVRHSNIDGTGRRLPAVERLAGIYADAYASYPWQPGVENNFAAVSRRAGWNFLFTFLGSVWNEYGPTITARMGRTPTRAYR